MAERKDRNVNTKLERVNISMAPELLERIDARSERTGDTRSNLIRRAVIQYLEAQDMIEQMQGLLPHMPEILELNRRALEESQAVKMSKQMSLADVMETTTLPQKSRKKR